MDQKHGCFASAPSPAAAQMPSRTQPPRPSNGGYDYGLCTGADLAPPALGATVSVTGPYVLDADHGWMEIHPVWSITVLAPAASSAPAASPHSGRQLACLAGTKDGLVTAIAAPANDGYSGDWHQARLTLPMTRAKGMLTPVIDPDSAVPPYEQVAKMLRDEIAQGTMTGRIPSVHTIAEHHQVSHRVAARALEILQGEGMIENVPGGGHVVRHPRP